MEYGFPLFKAHRAITGFFFMRLIQGSVKGKGRWKMDSLCSKHGTITVFFFLLRLIQGSVKGEGGGWTIFTKPIEHITDFFFPFSWCKRVSNGSGGGGSNNVFKRGSPECEREPQLFFFPAGTRIDQSVATLKEEAYLRHFDSCKCIYIFFYWI